jgi:hypothetical protein
VLNCICSFQAVVVQSNQRRSGKIPSVRRERKRLDERAKARDGKLLDNYAATSPDSML